MDAYPRCNQKAMRGHNQEHMSFIPNMRMFYHKVMPFGLRNAGETYKRLANMVFLAKIGKTMEIYMDGMRIESKKARGMSRI